MIFFSFFLLSHNVLPSIRALFIFTGFFFSQGFIFIHDNVIVFESRKKQIHFPM
jgi:hypothetical protein